MTPDRFIAAAFREIRPSVVDDAVHYRRTVLDRAAELARESVGDGELLPCPFCGKSCATLTNTKEMNKPSSCFMYTVVCDATADGCGTTVGYEFEAADAITAWNTRAREVGAGEKAVVAVPRERLQEWLAAFSEEKAAYSDPIHHIETSIVQIREALNSSASRSVGGDVFTADEMDTIRQWFDSVQDCNGGYLVPRDYVLAAEIYKRCGMRVPDSITALAGVSEGRNNRK